VASNGAVRERLVMTRTSIHTSPRSIARLLARVLVASSLLHALSSQIAAATPSFAKPPAPIPHETVQVTPVRIVDRAALRAKLLEHRAANLERFRAYRKAGIYPDNVYTPGLANVWRDQAGHYCAAATIIRASGQAALVAEVAGQDNFIKLADVTSGPLLDWILTSGLTQAEIALIQRPFRPVTTRPEIRPVRPVIVDAGLRAAETRRLAKLYAEIDAKLVASQQASLELAVDRLMAHPQLAIALLER
jgi:hypothetical protein